MMNPSRLSWCLLVAVGCTPAAPGLDLSAGALRAGGETMVTVSATVGDQPGTGTVSLTTSAGLLDDGTLTLAEGSARTRLRCPSSSPGCGAGAVIEITARWTSPAGSITRTLSVRVVSAAMMDGAVADAGSGPDGGVDGGLADGGVDAGQEDVEVLLAGSGLKVDGGTSLEGAAVIVLGRLGAPRTLAFSRLSSSDVFLGFDVPPESPALYLDRLLYVHGGVVRAWTSDDLNGPPDPDGGAPDAGLLDAGALDAGLFDAGNFGPFPLRTPEWNDPVVASCEGLFGAPDSGYVRALLPTRPGGLWLGCSESARGPIALLRNGLHFVTAQVPITPLVANERQVLGHTADGGVFVVSATETTLVPVPTTRELSPAGRTTPRGSFELVIFNRVTSRCVLGLVERDGGYGELALPDELADSSTCLAARFDGRTDGLLLPIVGGRGIGGVQALGFSRADAGRARDAGTDAGMADGGTLRFVAGPPSDFLVTPPVLSVDFTQPVELVGSH